MVGLDYGMTKAATCLTVVTKVKDAIVLIFQIALKNFDDNLLMDDYYEHSIPNLMKRYPVETIVADDCPQGSRTNKEMENKGFPIKLFDFHGPEKNRQYYSLRSHLKQNKLKYPEIRELMAEMKAMMEVRMKINVSIEAPKGTNDDRIDSLMMASIPFMEDDGAFSSTVVDYSNAIKKIEEENKKANKDWRHDSEWDKWKTSGINPTEVKI